MNSAIGSNASTNLRALQAHQIGQIDEYRYEFIHKVGALTRDSVLTQRLTVHSRFDAFRLQANLKKC